MKYIYNGPKKVVNVGGSNVNLISGFEYPKLIFDKFPASFVQVKEEKKVETPKEEPKVDIVKNVENESDTEQSTFKKPVVKSRQFPKKK